MTTDLERRLRDVLQTTTPEPPTSFRFAPSDRPEQTGADEMEPLPARVVARSRWAPLLAAAAVVVLGAGVAAVTLTRDDDRQPAATGPESTGPMSTAVSDAPVPTAPVSSERSPGAVTCIDDQLALAQSGTHRSGALLSTVVTVTNTGRTTCLLSPLPFLSVRPDPAGGTTGRSARGVPTAPLLPGSRLAAGYGVAFTVQLRVDRSCPVSERGAWTLNVNPNDGFEYTFQLPGANCPVVPYAAAAAVVPPR